MLLNPVPVQQRQPGAPAARWDVTSLTPVRGGQVLWVSTRGAAGGSTELCAGGSDCSAEANCPGEVLSGTGSSR